MLKRRTYIGAKIETTYGADAVVAGSDCFLAYNVIFKPDIDALTRNPNNGMLGMLSPQMGARRGGVTFTTDIYGSGTAGSVPAIDPLLRACGYTATTEAGVQVLYQPKEANESDPFESITINIWQDGVKNVLKGCRGNFSINMNMGQRGTMDWTFECKDFTNIDEAVPTGLYPTITPPVCLNQAFAIADYSAIIPGLKIDMNNTIQRAASVNESGGYARVDIVARDVKGSISPEAVLNSTHGFYDKWAAGTKSDLTITLGSVAGNIIKITAPRVHYTGFSFDDRSGIIANTLPFQFAGVATTVSGTITDAGSTTSIVASGTFVTDDLYNGARLTVRSGTLNGKARIITNTTASGTTATMETAFGGSPQVGATFDISPSEIQILFK